MSHPSHPPCRNLTEEISVLYVVKIYKQHVFIVFVTVMMQMFASGHGASHVMLHLIVSQINTFPPSFVWRIEER